MKKQPILTAGEIRAQITRARLDLSLHKSKNTNLVKNLRRQLAQVLTDVKP